MRVLVACEFSGVVRDAFRARGHTAFSCDLLPSQSRMHGSDGYHFQCDVRDLLAGKIPHDAAQRPWDLMIAHPDCTYLCSSGLHWNNRGRGHEGTAAALEFVRFLLGAKIHRIALENPQGKIGTAIRKADQYIQPHEYGHDASKKTGLWLKNLPLLKATRHIAPRFVNGRPRWANQTDSGQNKLTPSPTRWMERARFYTGWADAMAEQWGVL